MEAGSRIIIDQAANACWAACGNYLDLICGDDITAGFACSQTLVVCPARWIRIPGAGILIKDIAGISWGRGECAENRLNVKDRIWQVDEPHQLFVALRGCVMVKNKFIGVPYHDGVIRVCAETISAGDVDYMIAILRD